MVADAHTGMHEESETAAADLVAPEAQALACNAARLAGRQHAAAGVMLRGVKILGAFGAGASRGGGSPIDGARSVLARACCSTTAEAAARRACIEIQSRNRRRRQRFGRSLRLRLRPAAAAARLPAARSCAAMSRALAERAQATVPGNSTAFRRNRLRRFARRLDNRHPLESCWESGAGSVSYNWLTTYSAPR